MPDLKTLPTALLIAAALPSWSQTAPTGAPAPNPPSPTGKATGPVEIPSPPSKPNPTEPQAKPGTTSTKGVNVQASPPTETTAKQGTTSDKNVDDKADNVAPPATNRAESANPPPAAPAVNVTVQAPSAESPRSDLVSGWIGLGILAAAGFFGWKALARRGVTVSGLLARLGIEETTPAPPARPNASTPSGPTAPPLPSLSDLPAPPVPSPHTPSATPTPGRLTGIAGAGSGTTTRLSPGLTLGRDPGCGLVLKDDSVSRQHASFTWSPAAGWVVTDLGSSNGTFLNGRKVADPVALRTGDQVQFGESKFRFEDTP